MYRKLVGQEDEVVVSVLREGGKGRKRSGVSARCKDQIRYVRTTGLCMVLSPGPSENSLGSMGGL